MRRFEIHPQLKDSAGKPIHPASTLSAYGPLVDVVVSVPSNLHSSFTDAGKQVPPPLRIAAMIDTGCTRTAIDKEIIEKLQIAPTGTTTSLTASGPAPVELFPVQIDFPALQAGILIPQAMSCDLSGQTIDALVGCDLLKHFVMIYDGIAGRVTLIN